MSKRNFIRNLLCDFEIPEDSILVLHVKLKEIKKETGLSYTDLTDQILCVLNNKYAPKTILTPTFTYSFTKSGIFHRLFSKSETGRFSEEVRLNFADSRLVNPIFSFADVSGYFNNKTLNSTKAFGENTIFDYLDNNNTFNINIGLEKLISSQLHHVEKLNQVSYRYNKNFDGYIYLNQKKYKKIKFNYFVRDLDEDPRWDRNKIKEKLTSEDKLKTHTYQGIETNCIDSSSLKSVISDQLKKNDKWLLK